MMKVDYESYIRSGVWHKMREEFLSCMLFEGFCAACGGVPLTYHIHHMTYSRLGNENLEDLVALCERCHDLLHQYHRTHPKKANLWRASQQFIQYSRKAEGLDPYLFMPFEHDYKKHRKRKKQKETVVSKEPNDFVPRNRRPEFIGTDWRDEARGLKGINNK